MASLLEAFLISITPPWTSLSTCDSQCINW